MAASMALAVPAQAALLDFTDSSFTAGLTPISGGFSGIAGGIGFELTTSDTAGINFSQAYDGGAGAGSCVTGAVLACRIDGAGISDDEIRGATVSSGQAMKLEFDQLVDINTLYFLDLFIGTGTEQAAVSFDGGATFLLFNAILSSNGGYLASSAGLPKTATSILLTAFDGVALRDDGTNDYAFAGVEISAVPIPAALPLFGSALAALGLFGWRRKRSVCA